MVSRWPKRRTMGNEQNTKTEDGSQSAVVVVSPLVIAFIQGAKWWEYQSTRFTMWQSDQSLAQTEALKKEKDKTLGKLSKS